MDHVMDSSIPTRKQPVSFSALRHTLLTIALWPFRLFVLNEEDLLQAGIYLRSNG